MEVTFPFDSMTETNLMLEIFSWLQENYAGQFKQRYENNDRITFIVSKEIYTELVLRWLN